MAPIDFQVQGQGGIEIEMKHPMAYSFQLITEKLYFIQDISPYIFVEQVTRGRDQF